MDLRRNLFVLFFVIFFFNFTSCAADTKGSIAEKSPFTQIINKFYYVYTTAKMDWFDAVHYCRTLDSDLINIATKAEMEAITKYLISNGHLNKRFWTSANDLSNEGVFKSISNGQPITYFNWGSNEPNNLDQDDCVEILATGNAFYMNDYNCRPPLKYMPYTICERKNPEKVEAREAVPPSCAVKKLMEMCQSMGNIINCRN